MADSSGNDPQQSAQSRIAAGANTPMAKTIALVVLALIIGIVMINIVDDDGGIAKAGSSKTTVRTTTPTKGTGTTDTTTKGSTAATTTTVKASTLVSPAALKLIVVNSGAPTGSGGNISDALRARGYKSLAKTAKVTWKAAGLTVSCKPGLDRERAALVKALGGVPNYKAKTAAWKVQPGVPAAEQCYVSIGAAA